MVDSNKDIVHKKGIQKFGLNELPECDVFLTFHFAPFIDLKSFETECKKLNLPISVEIEDEDQKGLVLIRCDSINLIKNLEQVQNALGEPIKNAIQNTNFEGEIKETLKKTEYFKAVIKFIQQRYDELHESNVTKEQVTNEMYLKYGHIFGKEGAKKVANLFNEEKETIVKNYFNLQDYMLKHFSIEFFIQQQVQQGYFLIINITDKNKAINGNKLLTIQDFGLVQFEKRSLTLPIIGKIDNVFYSDNLSNVMITLNPSHKNSKFNYSMLRLKKLNTAILFIHFLFKKQSEGIKIDIESYEIESERIKSVVLNYDIKGIDDTLKRLDNLEEIIYAYLNEFLIPIKRFVDEIAPRAKKIETQTINEIFNVDVKFDSIVGKDKFNPPNWFNRYLFSGEFIKIRDIIYSSVDDTKALLKIIRELKEYLLKYKHEIKIRNKEQIKATISIITELLGGFGKILKKVILGIPAQFKTTKN